MASAVDVGWIEGPGELHMTHPYLDKLHDLSANMVHEGDGFRSTGEYDGGMICFGPVNFYTRGDGVPYMTEPGVGCVASTAFHPGAVQDYLDGFDASLGFAEYLNDYSGADESGDGAHLAKFGGQLCYQSFAENRTKNKDIGKYLDNIKAQSHGSVVEHATFSLLLWGVSRSFTHELVRHRVGMAYSQVSQRYCDGKVLRFVRRPEYRGNLEMCKKFEARIERAAADYDEIAKELIASGGDLLDNMSPRDARKAVNGAARGVLPNCTEAPILVTGNGRSWRHFLEQRGSRHAEREARVVANRVYCVLASIEPHLFSDYSLEKGPDGTFEIVTKYRKV